MHELSNNASTIEYAIFYALNKLLESIYIDKNKELPYNYNSRLIHKVCFVNQLFKNTHNG